MRYMCSERCYDSSVGRTYYEDEPYDLSQGDVKHLKEIGQFKRFRGLEPALAVEAPKEASDDTPTVEPPKPAKPGKPPKGAAGA
jgi:hypothetical protein